MSDDDFLPEDLDPPAPKRRRGGPFSLNFPERRAAELVRAGCLRVDSDGSVWRLRRLKPGGGFIEQAPKRIDYGSPRGDRFIKVTLKNGDLSSCCVHRLIWQLAHGDIPPKLTVNHKNGVPSDNRIENLELLTHGEQHLHRYSKLGHKAPAKTLKGLAVQFADAARIAVRGGQLHALREVLQAYDDYRAKLGPMARYKEAKQKV